MTLREKFQEEKIYINPYTFKLTKEGAKNFEVIADEFAIGFADWIRVCKLKQRHYDFDDVKELLKIYKDEKGL